MGHELPTTIDGLKARYEKLRGMLQRSTSKFGSFSHANEMTRIEEELKRRGVSVA